jgi:hypothetical protein
MGKTGRTLVALIPFAVFLACHKPADTGVVLDRPATVGESYVAFFAPADNGARYKTGSISNVWGVSRPTSAFGINRFNAGYLEDGVQKDDVSIRQFGNRGITLFAVADYDIPEDGVKLLVRGKTRIAGEIQADGLTLNGARLVVDGNSLKVLFSDGTTKTVALR